MATTLPEDGSAVVLPIKDGQHDAVRFRAGATIDVEFRIDGNDRPFAFSIVTPTETVGDPRIGFGTPRFERHSPLSSQEERNHGRLLRALGGVVVGAGRAEAAMKRILLLQAQTYDYATVDYTWSELLKRLTRVRAEVDGLSDLLTWAEDSRMTARRDNSVHAQ